MAPNNLSSDLRSLVQSAEALYRRHFSKGRAKGKAVEGEDEEGKDDQKIYVTVAPGRVNLIGEHTDYTGGFVLPLAIDYSTVVYGCGNLVENRPNHDVRVKVVSLSYPGEGHDDIEEATLTTDTKPPPKPNNDSNDDDDDDDVADKEEEKRWTNYVYGTIAMYMEDLPRDHGMDLCLAIAGNVPLGGGLSSSASLEVSVARFLECVLLRPRKGTNADVDASRYDPKTRALRCQRAENVWCHSPCGIMDQYVSSAASDGALLLIDCTSLEYEICVMKEPHNVALVVTDSNVRHDIAGGEYPVRVSQCQRATEALRQQIMANTKEKDDEMADSSSSSSSSVGIIRSLRDVSPSQVEEARNIMNDDVTYRRARHVVTENARTLAARDALRGGDWETLGRLMNQSHASMRDDYEVSCHEIDVLVELAQNHPGVYGSRLTGGGFGGCTVTLVEKDQAEALMGHLKERYQERVGMVCTSFITLPGPGARLIEELPQVS